MRVYVPFRNIAEWLVGRGVVPVDLRESRVPVVRGAHTQARSQVCASNASDASNDKNKTMIIKKKKFLLQASV